MPPLIFSLKFRTMPPTTVSLPLGQETKHSISPAGRTSRALPYKFLGQQIKVPYKESASLLTCSSLETMDVGSRKVLLVEFH